MHRTFTSIFFIFLVINLISGQTLFEEDFETGSLPPGWSIESSATDGGWKVGTPSSLSSQYFDIPENGSTNIIGTNDDNCNCNKSNEYLITPAIDLSTASAAILSFDSYFLANSYQGSTEDGTIEVSLDGTNWTVLEDLHGHNSWDKHTINLSDYIGNATVYIGFKYDDNGGFLYGFGIDNVTVKVPAALEVELVELNEKKFGEVGRSIAISGTIFNGGATAIETLEFTYTLDAENPIIEVISNLEIAPFTFYEFESTTPWTPDAEGVFNVEVIINKINGVTDDTPFNDVISYSTEIFPLVEAPDKMADFLDGINLDITELTGASAMLNKPTDLDFFPINGKDELWIINQRSESDGGSTITIDNATKGPTNFAEKIDDNSWHFMSLPTAIAFSDDNFNFANSPGVKDANHNGGTFTGPALWSSDPLVYAQPSGGNGSHLDMLHGSPFSMGIAHEIDNVFWVYDDWNKDIVRYDFQDDHGPGNDDHADAIVRRFKNIGIDADGDIPNHMILDKTSGWIYFVDNGNDRVVRLDINSGTGSTNLALINEELAEHSSITGFTHEVIIDSGLEQPCGIEIFNNYLLVGDYFNGQIIVYDMLNNFDEMGRLETGSNGLTGIKVGPDGNIWYTNRLSNGLFVANPGFAVGTKNTSKEIEFTVSPNPTNNNINIVLKDDYANKESKIQIVNSVGQIIQEHISTNERINLDISNLPSGLYLVNIFGEGYYGSKKIIVLD